MSKLTLNAVAAKAIERLPKATRTTFPGNAGNDGLGKDGYQARYSGIKKVPVTTKGGVTVHGKNTIDKVVEHPAIKRSSFPKEATTYAASLKASVTKGSK